MFKYIPLLIILVLISCSSPVSIPKRNLTQREKALERYRQMRLKSWKKEADKYRNKRVVIRPKKRVRRIIKTDIAEQRVILEQNRIFYCMKNRKNKRFNAANTCQDYTQLAQSECLKKFNFGDLALTKCVKRKLR